MQDLNNTPPRSARRRKCKHPDVWFCRSIEMCGPNCIDEKMHDYCTECGMSDCNMAIEKARAEYKKTGGVPFEPLTNPSADALKAEVNMLRKSEADEISKLKAELEIQINATTVYKEEFLRWKKFALAAKGYIEDLCSDDPFADATHYEAYIESLAAFPPPEEKKP